jgi:hypothetical protein
MSGRFWVFLLLGSYDEATLQILKNTKEQVSQRLMNEADPVLILMLDTVDIYSIEISESGNTRKITVIAEKYDNKVAIFTLNAAMISDAIDINLKSTSDIDKLVKDYFRKKYEVISFTKLAILPKLKVLASAASMVFLVRDREETRGGEYIELVFMLGSSLASGAYTYLLKKEGIALSEMAWEILAEYGVSYRSYDRMNDLFVEITRLTRNHIRKSLGS